MSMNRHLNFQWPCDPPLDHNGMLGVMRVVTRGGWGKSGQGQIGPLVDVDVTRGMTIGIKVVMILL